MPSSRAAITRTPLLSQWMWPRKINTASATARVLTIQLFRKRKSFLVPGCMVSAENRRPQNAAARRQKQETIFCRKGMARLKPQPKVHGVRREAKRHAAFARTRVSRTNLDSPAQKRCRRCALPPQSKIFADRDEVESWHYRDTGIGSLAKARRTQSFSTTD